MYQICHCCVKPISIFRNFGDEQKNIGTDTVFPKTEKSAVVYLLQIIELPVRNAESKRELALLRKREEFPMGEIFLK